MSCRTELTGILAALYLLRVLSVFTSISITSKQEVYCDNMAVVVHSNRPLEPGITAHIAADYDIMQEIWSVKDSGIDLDTWWVKAHQDNKIAADLLPLDARLHVQADSDVTGFHLSPTIHLSPSSWPIIFPSVGAHIKIDGVYITSQLQQWIQDNYNSSNIASYIMRQMGLMHTLMQQIE
eukprot:4494724-Ditylum_brightwellii.AAC.1